MKTSGQNFHLHRNFMYSTVKEYIVHKQKKMMKKISTQKLHVLHSERI